MSRVRHRNPENLPPRVYKKHGAYYFASTTGWKNLGREWNLEARVKWAELAGESAPEGTVNELLNEYEKHVVPKKARRTQLDNLEELKRIRAVFGRMLVSDLKLKHASTYLKERGAKVRGNREIALFAHSIRWGMNEGLCSFDRHPFELLMYNKETPRTRRVEHPELERFLTFARSYCPPVAATTWLMDLMGQRRIDVLAMKRSAGKAEGVDVSQSKTGVRLVVEWTDELTAAWAYALEVHHDELAKKNIAGFYAICTRDGQRYTDSGMKALFARTMAAALSCEHGPPVLVERFRHQDIRPKAASDVGGGKRAKDLLGHKTQATTDRVYDRVTVKRVKPTR
jgi:integrase